MKRIFCLLSLCLLLCACAGEEKCTVSQSGGVLSLAFDGFSGTRSAALTLSAGDTLDVCIERQSGRIDLTLDGASRVYAGNDAQSGAFTLVIPADGDYTLTLSGKRAGGSVTVAAGE